MNEDQQVPVGDLSSMTFLTVIKSASTVAPVGQGHLVSENLENNQEQEEEEEEAAEKESKPKAWPFLGLHVCTRRDLKMLFICK